MTGYCEAALGHPEHGPYHDTEYGFPIRDEAVLFERLLLEINQAGLSWLLILRKRAGFRTAYADFLVDAVARFTEADYTRLLGDQKIIRNKLKIAAAITNAQKIQTFRDSHGGFANWLDAHHPLGLDQWCRLFKRNFKFTGGEITKEFLLSLGYLPGAHTIDCPIHTKIMVLEPPWLMAERSGFSSWE